MKDAIRHLFSDKKIQVGGHLDRGVGGGSFNLAQPDPTHPVQFQQ